MLYLTKSPDSGGNRIEYTRDQIPGVILRSGQKQDIPLLERYLVLILGDWETTDNPSLQDAFSVPWKEISEALCLGDDPGDTAKDKKSLRKRLDQEYKESLVLSERLWKSKGKVRFSNEMKPGPLEIREASAVSAGNLGTSILKSLRKGKYYTEENILSVLTELYREHGVTKEPRLEDLAEMYTVTRVWKDRTIKVGSMSCKCRDFYVKLM